MRRLEAGQRVYFIAIAGSGMSALAGLLQSRGCVVQGSDLACYPPVSHLLDSLGVEVRIGYDLEHLKAFNPDYVVIGNFVRPDNPQARYVLDNSIPYGSLPSTLETQFLQYTTNHVVCGTHGKSTTASCLAHLLQSGGRKPSFFIGAVPANFTKSFQLGEGEDFVLEGDEYDTAFFDKESKFLHYLPKVVLWTSLEYDHADIFPSMERIEQMFEKLLKKIPEDGCLIYNRDWESVHQLIQKTKSDCPSFQSISYGFHEEADQRIRDFSQDEEGMSFRLGEFQYFSQMQGRFNAQNFSAAIIAGTKAGLSKEVLETGLRSFRGLKRRQELLASIGEHRVIDDFAHHPTAVKEVIHSLRARFPEHQLVVLFEPRSNTTRRNIFQKAFVEAFKEADYVLLPELFKKEALAEKERLDLSRLVSDLRAQKVKAKGPLSTEELTQESLKLGQASKSVFAILSNGAFDGLHEKLISALDAQ